MFCQSLIEYRRRPTSVVRIGNVEMGGENPVRLQSMTNTPTNEIDLTVAQCVRMIEAGAEMVRITTPTAKDTEYLGIVKNELLKRGYQVPVIADVHFSAKTAEAAAEHADKVRINPGNFTDTKKFSEQNYTEEQYADELNRIREKFIPFLDICKKNKVGIRIGTNHGSLSDRIMNRFGDTPLGMVESSLEFLRICREEGFSDVVISMKAGNPKVMIQAVRLLVEKMAEENMDFPLHLGVTEAGEGEDGRVKSAVGIGCLLADGIGDTIRVSLTEDPEEELPAAKILTRVFFPEKLSKFKTNLKINRFNFDSETFQAKVSREIAGIGAKNVPIICANQSNLLPEKKEKIVPDLFFDRNKKQFIHSANNSIFKFDLFSKTNSAENNSEPYFLEISCNDIQQKTVLKEKIGKNAIILADFENQDSFVHAGRIFFLKLKELGIDNPVIIKYSVDKFSEYEQIKAAGEIGTLMVDGFGDGIFFDTKDEKSIPQFISLGFSILQACRRRMTKTEYISCPSCGRTLFDLKETTAKIKAVTAHLKHLKIGIMGCIVNGPGEMADADYGYVGTGKGRITLYKQKEVVKKNIPENDAVEELVTLIKSCNDWREPDLEI